MNLIRNNYKIYNATVNTAGQIMFSGDGLNESSAGIPLFSEMPDWKFITLQIDNGAGLTLAGYTTANITLTPNASAIAATAGDGSTAVSLAGAAGSVSLTIARENGLGAISNIAGLLGFVAAGTPTGGTASVTVLVQ